MWLPVVNTWQPSSNSSSAIAGVSPKPPAAFSALAMTRSTWLVSTRWARWSWTILRPALPKMSPMNRICIKASFLILTSETFNTEQPKKQDPQHRGTEEAEDWKETGERGRDAEQTKKQKPNHEETLEGTKRETGKSSLQNNNFTGSPASITFQSSASFVPLC